MEKILFEPRKLRELILKMAVNGNAGHIGCSFSLVEIVSVLFSENQIYNYNSKNPKDSHRDILALSKGHGVMALYACFYQLGWLIESQIQNYFKNGSDLFGLAEEHIDGLEISGGTLGHGLPVAVGMAWGFQRKNLKRKVICIVGDGELNEGSMWEALLFAGHHKLSNLIIIVDANRYQAMGLTSEIMNMEPLREKFSSFRFNYFECNGHNVDQIVENLKHCSNSNLPSVLVARTIKGAGVDFMEANNNWHYFKLTDTNLIEKAFQQVQSGRIPGDTK